MVCSGLGLLCGTGFSGDVDFKALKNTACRTGLDHPAHTALYDVPVLRFYVHGLNDIGFVTPDGLSLPVRHTIQDREIKDRAAVGERRHIARKLYVGKGVRTLSDGRPLRALIRNHGIVLDNFNTGLLVQAKHDRILAEALHAKPRVILALRIRRETMTEIRKERVTGISDTGLDVLESVTSRINPTAKRRRNLIVNTGTINGIGETEYIFLKCRKRSDGLKGRTRRFSRLRRVVVKRKRFVLYEARVVTCVHRVGQTIVVVPRIGYQRFYLAGCDIGHDTARGTGIQRKLCRCDFQIRHELYKIAVCVGWTV